MLAWFPVSLSQQEANHPLCSIQRVLHATKVIHPRITKSQRAPAMVPLSLRSPSACLFPGSPNRVAANWLRFSRSRIFSRCHSHDAIHEFLEHWALERFSRMVANHVPVGHQKADNSFLLIRSATKKQRALTCFVGLLLEAFPSSPGEWNSCCLDARCCPLSCILELP